LKRDEVTLTDQGDIWQKGRFYEEFHVDQCFEHHWGRTLSEFDNTAFTVSTLSFNPIYFNRAAARAEGHPDLVINPYLLLSTVIGLSVEDLSEVGGAFLEMSCVEFHCPVYPGETVWASSCVTDLHLSKSRPGFGVASWRTVGQVSGEDSDRRNAVTLLRSNLLPSRSVLATDGGTA
jgi:itaconyl-CoA hydratase